MKLTLRGAGSLATLLLAVALAGCATQSANRPGGASQADEHKAHHPDASTTPAPAAPGDKSSNRGMEMKGGGMMAMCDDMHQKMMAAKTPQERQAMMQEHMKSMSPEMRQKMHEQMHGSGGMACH